MNITALPQIVTLPPVFWSAASEAMTYDEARAIERELSAIAEQTARCAAYLSMRHSIGGDQGHDKAVKKQNHAAQLTRKALNYTLHHSPIAFDERPLSECHALPVDKPLSWDEIEARLESDNRIKVVIAIPVAELSCLGGDLDGLNDWIDDKIFSNADYYGSVMDINYDVVGHRPAGKDEASGYVLIEVDADASDLERQDDG